MRRPQKFEKISCIVLTLLCNFKTRWEIFFKFCGLLTISELLKRIGLIKALNRRICQFIFSSIMIGNGIGRDQCMPRPPISLRRTCMAMNLEICVPLYEGRNNRFLFLERVNQKSFLKLMIQKKRRRK